MENLHNKPVVMFCGSRSLSGQYQPLVMQLVLSSLKQGAALSVGCAAGADSIALSSALALGAGNRLSVFAVGGADGRSFAGRASCYSGVYRALSNGAQVTWWAGGTSQVPLRARLAGRSLACVRSVHAGGAGSRVTALVSALPARPFSSGHWPSCGSGTWASLAAAARQGLSVVLVPVAGLSAVTASQLPTLEAQGTWSAVTLHDGIHAFAWHNGRLL